MINTGLKKTDKKSETYVFVLLLLAFFKVPCRLPRAEALYFSPFVTMCSMQVLEAWREGKIAIIGALRIIAGI